MLLVVEPELLRVSCDGFDPKGSPSFESLVRGARCHDAESPQELEVVSCEKRRSSEAQSPRRLQGTSWVKAYLFGDGKAHLTEVVF